MRQETWNRDWKVSSPNDNPLMASVQGKHAVDTTITLPHDAMILEQRTQDTKNQHQTGFYPGGLYFYDKSFFVPEDWADKTAVLEFEGVYKDARVYINGDYAGGFPGGYSNFFVEMNDFLRYGQDNNIHVIANNSMEQNSRWFSGSGIYRNVNLYLGGECHLTPDGLRITTPEISSAAAIAAVELHLKNEGSRSHSLRIHTVILDECGKAAASESTPVTLFRGEQTICRQRICVRTPLLWDLEHPYLYTCQVTIMENGEVLDTAESSFGVRRIGVNPVEGFTLNGKTVKLRGACIHHDNGIIGACTLERAEERRVELMKCAGFNCLRSAHNPISRAMLDACDKHGMLVLDELSDAWTRSKNHNDNANDLPTRWEDAVTRMVAKDYNHPSVVMYLTGNEIQEAGTAKGAQMNRAMAELMHTLDPNRYTICAINGLLAIMDRIGEVFEAVTGKSMTDLMQELEQNGSSNAGSDAVNSMLGALNGPMQDAMSTSQILTDILEEFTDATDLAGYNYLTARHALEAEINPNRVVLGTETLPSDIARLWKIVENNPHVIGDMTWTGWDYLGEAGIGNFFYDGRFGFLPNWPCSVAYCGDFDITGLRRSISYYRETVYGLRKAPYIAVERLTRYGLTPMKTGWSWTDSIHSWTWPGYEGKNANIEVYSSADEVELLLNGSSLGRKQVGTEAACLARFTCTYEAGTLEAVAYIAGEESGRDVLYTAEEQVTLDVRCDRTVLNADGADLAYLTVGWKDTKGRENLNAKKAVTVHVDGAGQLQGFGSGDPDTPYRYQDTCQETYDGRLVAAIRAGHEPGVIRVSFCADGCDPVNIRIDVK